MREMRGFVVVAALLAASSTARADTPTGVPFLDELGTREEGQLEVYQNRKHRLTSEIFGSIGGLPADPYNKGLTFTGGYAIHFNDFVAWEVGQFTYAITFDSDLKQRLERLTSLYTFRAPQLPEINWFVSSHLVLKPIYGKQAIFNRKIIHIEAFALAGPAIINRSVPDTEFNVGANVGAGMRVWIAKNTSVRFDIQELLFYGTKTNEFESALHLHLGLAFNLGDDD
jgi:outer membrane beta-barrel protein